MTESHTDNDTSIQRYDVIIVGARAAGAPTAMLLARRGHRVLLVDRATFPSDTLSTHLCQPRAMAYLHRWGLAAELRESTPVFSEFVLDREGIVLAAAPAAADLASCLMRAHGWSTTADGSAIPVEWSCVRRSVLDTALARAAARAGADVREGFRVTDLERRGDRIAGIRGEHAGREIIAWAPLVVGADGRGSLIAREVGAEVLATSNETDFACYSYFRGVPLAGLRLPLRIRGRLAVAAAPTSEAELLVSVFGPEAWAADFKADLERHFLAAVEAVYPELGLRLRSATRTAPLRGMARQPAVFRRAHGPGWALVGDAGQTLSQCTAIGITNAFRDAELLAHRVSAALANGTSIDAATAAYDHERTAASFPYFDLVADASRCALPTREQLGLLCALQHDRAAAGRMVGVLATVVPVPEFFAPEEVQRLLAAAPTPRAPILAALEAANTCYSRNPFTTHVDRAYPLLRTRPGQACSPPGAGPRARP
jgi:2-polyprenyl-6-methoxyphenol hydroxylase-like FAD-dependent oxidoreductase